MKEIVGISIEPENDLMMGKTEAHILGIALSDGEKFIEFKSVKELFRFISNGVAGRIKRIVSSDLRRDGEFILSYMMNDGFKPIVKKEFNIEEKNLPDWAKDKWAWANKEELREKEFTIYITERGGWYDIIFRYKKKIFEIFDLSKMIPGELGELSENLLGKRVDDFSPYDISVASNFNPRILVNRATAIINIFNFARSNGMEKDTIGMNCLSFFTETLARGWKTFKSIYPNLYEIKIDSVVARNVGDYVRRAYGGGFLYLNEKFRNKRSESGFMIDVSSLYTSRMHSQSGEVYPQGQPEYGIGECKPRYGEICFQAIYCEFRIKDGKLPFIKVQNSYLYPGGMNLESSDYWCVDGWRRNRILMVLKFEELQLFLNHYEIIYMEYVDYVKFNGRCGIYDAYIDRWWEKKINAANKSERFIAKLYQNNLPGKFASAREGAFRFPEIDNSGEVYFKEMQSLNPHPGYIAVGACVLSNARVFQIKNCQKVHDDGKFIYSDTDCIFGIGSIPEYLDVAQDKLGAYKIEGFFDWCYMQKPKRYIAKMMDGAGDIISRSGNTFKFSAAGLSDRGKALFLASMGEPPLGVKNLTYLEKKFICEERTVEDFKEGLTIPGQRMARRVKGGIVYEENEFTIIGGEKNGIL